MKQEQLLDEYGEKFSPIITLEDDLTLDQYLQGYMTDAADLFERSFNLKNGSTYGSLKGASIGDNFAMGRNAIALGDLNIASGENSAAFGKNSMATGINSSVFGNQNVATGQNSVAFGDHVGARHKNSFICGQYGETNPDTMFAVGCGTESEKKLGFEVKNTGDCYANGYNLSSLLAKLDTDFLGYRVYDTEPTEEQLIADGIGPNDIFFVEIQSEIGGGSGVGRINTTQSYIYNGTAYSHNVYSPGEIFNNYEQNMALSSYSHAEGNRTKALGDSSHAEGIDTIASGLYSHAGGDTSIASGYASYASGGEAIASGDYAYAVGCWATASGESSFAEGEDTTASGYAAHAEGNGTTASGSYAHAEGYYTNATRYSAHAEGNYTTASGNYSHAEGYYTKATGYTSHTEGDSTTASGEYSHAGGYNATAYGSSHFAHGCYVATNSYNDKGTAIFGKYATTNNDTQFGVGIGSYSTNELGLDFTKEGVLKIKKYITTTANQVPTDGQVLSYNATDNIMKWIDPPASSAPGSGSGITSYKVFNSIPTLPELTSAGVVDGEIILVKE